MKYVHDTKNPAALAFLADLARVCERHGLMLDHEDRQGAFIVRPLEKDDPEWAEGWSVYDQVGSE